MTILEKIVIPLIDENLNIGDISPNSGLIDSYTSDPDKPFLEEGIFLVYDDTLRTEDTKKAASKLNSLSSLRYTYVKYVENKPYFVYNFYPTTEWKKLLTGHIVLTPKQTKRIIEFWGELSEVSDYICSNKNKYITPNHPMPLEDYMPSMFDIV